MMRALHVYFSGTVQGVGFRYTTKRIADRLGVTGWVRNLSDGRVELVAQGADDTLEAFLLALQDEMSGYVSGIEREWQNSTNVHNTFAILPTQ
jgi:acylphosphatase